MASIGYGYLWSADSQSNLNIVASNVVIGTWKPNTNLAQPLPSVLQAANHTAVISLSSSNVGICTSPNTSYALDINGTANTIALRASGLTANRVVTTDANKNLVSSTATSTELGYLSGVTSPIQTQLNTISGGTSSIATGILTSNIGINTSVAPTSPQVLDVWGNASFGGVIETGRGVSTGRTSIELGQHRTGDGNCYIDFHSASGNDYDARVFKSSGTNGDLSIANQGTGSITFQANGGAERMRLDTTGKLGIGTTTPSTLLHVHGGSLGTTAGNSTDLGRFSTLGSNDDALRVYAYRHTTGSDWTSASTRIAKKVDNSDMAYIEFNPSGAGGQSALAFGTGTTETARITSAGNFGIKCSPAYPLDVLGNINTASNILTAGTVRIDRVGNLSNISTVNASGVITGSSVTSTVVTGTAPLTVTSTTLVNNLNVQYLNGQQASYYTNVGNASAGTLAVAHGGTGLTSFTANKLMVASTDGASINMPTGLHWDNANARLGIGISSPLHALDVTGNIRTSGIIYVGSDIMTTNAVTTYNTGSYLFGQVFDIGYISVSPNADGSKFAAAGSVSIKAQTLQWSGGGINRHGAEIFLEGGKSPNAEASSSGDIVFKIANSEAMRLTAPGYLGIGTTPTYPLHICASASNAPLATYYYLDSASSSIQTWGNSVAKAFKVVADGNFWASGGGFYVSSDLRIKKEIADITPDDALSIIDNLKPSTFKYIDRVAHGDIVQHGFIAQEVKEVLPSAVSVASNSFVPSCYQKAQVQLASEDSTSQIAASLLTFQTPHGLIEGDTIKYYTRTGEFTATVGTTTELTIIINESVEHPEDGVMVYGKKVDDFMTLEDAPILSVAVACIKAQSKKIAALEATLAQNAGTITTLEANVAQNAQTITTLEAGLAQNTQTMTALETRLAALEARQNLLKSIQEYA